jgi:5-methylcytosine-specific restriction endonuclease McrA
LCKELAEVVSLEDGQYATYDFQSWSELSEFRARNFRQEDDDWVRTPTTEIQAPRVIRLLGYDKMPKQTVKFNRRNIFARDHNQCQYCGKKFPTSELSLDHVFRGARAVGRPGTISFAPAWTATSARAGAPRGKRI